MSFETPEALWGLGTLALLVLFSLWRQAAARIVIPSVLLWKKIPERHPPLRALRRPRWRLEILLQALALALAVTALAGPFLASARSEPRKVALVFDTSARMLAGDKMSRLRGEARRLLGKLAPGDEVVVYAALPFPRRGLSLDEVRPIHAHVDPGPLLEAAREESPHVVYFSDRPPERAFEGLHQAFAGGPADNVGIVEFSATDAEVFVRIANHGPERGVPLRLVVDGTESGAEIQLPPGGRSWWKAGDFSRAREIRVELDARDSFPLDDVVRAARLGPTGWLVSVNGQHVPQLVRALESVGGIAVRRGGGEALVSIGVDVPPGLARLGVRIHFPRSPVLANAVTVSRHPLTAGMEGREREIASSRVGELECPSQAERLMFADGRVIGALWEGVVHLSIDLAPGGWPITPAFPIFWKNVIDYAKRGAEPFVVLRTGRPLRLPPEVEEILPLEGGALYERAGGNFVTFTTGEFEARMREGRRILAANLVDPRESDTAGAERPLPWDLQDPAGRVTRRHPLSGYLAAAVLALLAAAWVLQRRAE